MMLSAMVQQATQPVAAPAHRVEELAWFSGAWETDHGKTHIEEYWTRPAGNMMIGMGRMVRDEKTVSFEFLRLEQRADGIYYVAQPYGRPPVDFKLDALEQQTAVFVNPGHADHLKRITYRKNPDGTLFGRVEGVDNGKAFAEELAYRPAK
jgi:hypothetical protein